MKKIHVRSVMYLSTLLSVAAVAGAAYAEMRSGDGAPSRGALALQDPARDAAPLQIPVDSRFRKLVFAVAGTDVIRTVVTSANNPTGPLYGAGLEYWSGNDALAVTNLTSLTMTSSTAQLSEADISAFLLPGKSWGPVLGMTQQIGTAGWTQGIYQPTATKRRLFEAIDPDDASRFIGMLIEQDASNTLQRITWYKTALTGTIFAQAPQSLSFSAVLNASGQASTSPTDIDPQATWYYASGP